MQSFGGDEDERDSPGSPEGSFDDEDAAGQGDPETIGAADAEVEGEADNEEDNDDNDEEEDEPDQEGSQDSFGGINGLGSKSMTTSQPSLLAKRSTQGSSGPAASTIAGPTSHPNPAALQPSAFHPNTPLVRPEALTAPVYDIVPTIAAPHSTSINAITATPDLRWVFSGGSDGYIRKFNWVETANGKSMLTVAQKHPFVDSVTKAGVLMSYWENEDQQPKAPMAGDGPAISAVYSLAVHNEGLWLLSGLESGGINLQSIRHDEGKLIHSMRKHTSAVSVLTLSQDERSALSGSWDKTVIDWDLDTGKAKRTFEGSGGQISALETRPLSSLPVPEACGDVPLTNGTLASDSLSKPRPNGLSQDILDVEPKEESLQDGLEIGEASPTDSLFVGGEADSLFGDNDDGEVGAPSTGNFTVDAEDDEFSLAIANGIQEQENADTQGDIDMTDAKPATGDTSLSGPPTVQNSSAVELGKQSDRAEIKVPNGLPHSDDSINQSSGGTEALPELPQVPSPGSTFLAASMDGTLRVWDKRQATAVAKILPRNTPPWCMNACWSPDGNFIYAGRRNGTVEEFSLHKGLRGAERTFKLPNGSGPVSAVRAMPNGRHLICASYDILRLYDLQQQQTFKHSTVPFLIVPGHRTGVISQLYLDPTCRYMISTAGSRGWEGSSTEVLLGYEIGIGK
ncbi:MAG: hypothetical protein Q9191_003548 [Dirinaria sp. TL-2023a]